MWSMEDCHFLCMGALCKHFAFIILTPTLPCYTEVSSIMIALRMITCSKGFPKTLNAFLLLDDTNGQEWLLILYCWYLITQSILPLTQAP